MCFRPPTVEMADTKCSQCGHENFIGVTKCSQCGASLNATPLGTGSADSRDWSKGLEFERQAAPTGAAMPPGPAPPSIKPLNIVKPNTPTIPQMPKSPGSPKSPAQIPNNSKRE
jgi:hypothetical protein